MQCQCAIKDCPFDKAFHEANLTWNNAPAEKREELLNDNAFHLFTVRTKNKWYYNNEKNGKAYCFMHASADQKETAIKTIPKEALAKCKPVRETESTDSDISKIISALINRLPQGANILTDVTFPKALSLRIKNNLTLERCKFLEGSTIGDPSFPTRTIILKQCQLFESTCFQIKEKVGLYSCESIKSNQNCEHLLFQSNCVSITDSNLNAIIHLKGGKGITITESTLTELQIESGFERLGLIINRSSIGFLDTLNFSGILDINAMETYFFRAPKVFKCTFSEESHFPTINYFKQPKPFDYEKYRVIKNKMVDARKRIEIAKFHVLEQRALRKRMKLIPEKFYFQYFFKGIKDIWKQKRPILERLKGLKNITRYSLNYLRITAKLFKRNALPRLTSFLYDEFSHYGTNYSLVLTWILLFFFSFSSAYTIFYSYTFLGGIVLSCNQLFLHGLRHPIGSTKDFLVSFESGLFLILYILLSISLNWHFNKQKD